MEDEEVVKAPVTRLRRRLSVEQSDDAKSSSLPNTPTKKRGGRKAARPELDLIDENATESLTPKNVTKKANIKELEMDEKPVTPSRRSARIRSNTSIVLETTLATDSPRAKRAARRTSQVGSDNEAPLTPARQTRRTRKDSANTDKEPQPTNKPVGPIVEIIAEEPESSSQNSQISTEKSIELNESSTVLRKSPRLSLKKNKNSGSKEPKNNDLMQTNEKEMCMSEDHNNSNKENEFTSEEIPKNVSQHIEENDKDSNGLSISTTELLQKIGNEPTKNKNINKSSSAMLDIQSKHKRNRSKSWTNLSCPVESDNKCYSDSESVKKNKQALNKPSNPQEQNICLNLKNVKDTANITDAKKRKSVLDISENEIKVDAIDSPNQKGKLLSPAINNPTQTSLFNEKPTNTMQVLMFIEESDSNPDKTNASEQVEDEDQCVPIVKTHFEIQKTPPQTEIKNNILNFNQEKETYAVNKLVDKNDSCEPMDVDVTIPDSFIINESTSKTLHTSETQTVTKLKHEVSSSGDDKDKCKLQILDKTENENKSTLVLSQLKDLSNENHESQSPQSTTKLKLPISLNDTQDNETDKKKLGLTYSTSTPLQQKGLLKNTIAVNSSGITSNNTSKIESFDGAKINKSNTSKSSPDQSESNNESSDEESNDDEKKFINDEAEEASDNYESGDSRDPDEEQYEKDNEIVQKGETLTSEDELSNDTDYEKDSFVVSSDEEDNDLLDVSGDDLSLSDNELKMTTKSKKKYDARKMKEQKLASREMFESRHKLNVSNKSDKSSSSKIKKNRAIHDSSDSEDLEIKVNKKKKMRLDSSHEMSTNKSLDNNSQSKSLSNESNTNKAVNISIQFIDPEKKEGDADKTQINMNQTVDPLDDASSCNSSDSSNNVHIENYDLILNDLNKNVNTMKNKKGDVSLNLNKKTKKKSPSIVDELNLTEVKPHNLKKKKQNDPILESSPNNLNDESNKSVLNTTSGMKKSDSEFSQEKMAIEKPNKSLKDNSKKCLSSKKRSSSKHEENEYSEDELTAKHYNKPINEKPTDSHLEKRLSTTKPDSSDDKVNIENKTNEKSRKSLTKNELTKEDSGESSASIDLHLLFSEDSNNSEDVQVSAKDEESKTDNSFIPLRKSQGKTNILEVSGFQDASLTESAKKRKKKHNKSLEKFDDERETSVDNNEVHLFMDTTGTHCSPVIDDFLNASKSTSKKKKEKSVVLEDTDKNSDSDAPLEVSNKNAKDVQQPFIVIDEAIDTSSAAPNISMGKSPKSDKKKKRLSGSESIVQAEAKDTSTKKRKSKNLDATDNNEARSNISGTPDKSINISVTKTPKSEKKKTKRMSESQSEEQKYEHSTGETAVTKSTSNISVGDDDGNSCKLKLTDETESGEAIGGGDTSLNSSKKAKVNKNEDVLDGSISNKLISKSDSATKKSKKISESDDIGDTSTTKKETIVSSKKRKRKSSLNQTDKKAEVEEPVNSATNNSDTSIAPTRNKKRKISHNIDNAKNVDHVPMTNVKLTAIERQGREMTKQTQLQDPDDDKKDIKVVSTKRATTKRKAREDDEGTKTAKMLKVDTSIRTQIPRLPISILNKLDDMPKKKNVEVTNLKAISTCNFTVEEAKIKRIKPSNYLEESIYLNEAELSDSKKPKHIKNPKVLPFLPTVSTSSSGYTTNFKVNILPKEIKFVAKSSNINNFKNEYLEKKKLKRLGTYELYKRNRNIKMSKF